jgi:hypothetical protein
MRSRTLLTASVLVVMAGSLLIAGCGGSASRSTSAAAQPALVTYANCMHSHGVPDFPEPVAGQGIPKGQLLRLVGSPQFSAATSACKHVMPASGLGPQSTRQSTRVRLAAALVFSRCLRDRGFPNFPDPTAQGELTPQMVTAAGIDLHQPALLHAGLACAPLTHGVITRAAVKRAVNGG